MSTNWLLKKLIEEKRQKLNTLDRMLFVILMMGMLLIIALFSYMIWFLLTNKSITNYLPAEKTVAYFELSDLNLPPKLPQETFFGITGISAILKGTFGLETESLKNNLAQGRIGLAMIQGGNDEGKIVLFFRPRSKSGALTFFRNIGLSGEVLTETKENNITIFSYPQSRNFSFSFIGSYMFISQDAETLKLIQTVSNKAVPSLGDDMKYQKSLANLPRSAWGNGYLDLQLVRFPSGSSVNQLSDPLKSIIDHVGITIRKQDNGFHFNTLMSMNPSMLSLDSDEKESSIFSFSLADFIGSKNIAAYFGGASLGDEWQNTLTTMSNINPAYGLILEGILNAQVNKVLGSEVSLRDDIYPLLNNEYAVVFEQSPATETTPSHPVYKLILKNTDLNFAKTKLAKIMNGYKMLAAQFAPKLKVVALPDGTESKELVADPTKLGSDTESHKNYDINCTIITDSTFGLCYTVTDSLIVISNSIDSVKETIDLTLSPKAVLSQSQPFRKSLSNLSEVSDELTYVSIDNAENLLKNSPAGQMTASILAPFEAISWVKHYFSDGMSTEGYLLLK